MKPKKLLIHTFTHLVLILLAIVTLVPFVHIVLIALGENVVGTGVMVPQSFTLENFRLLVTETHFLRWMTNSFVIAASTVLIAVILVSISVFALSRLRFYGRQHLFNSILLIQVFPLTLSMVSIFRIFAAMGLLNRLSGLIIVNAVLASAGLILIAKGYFDTIPMDIDEAARIDGASRLKILWKINLPLAKPMMTLVAIQSFVIAYNEYVISSSVMTQGLDRMPLAVGLQSMIMGQYGTNWSLYCAGATIGSIPMILTFFSLQKYFIGGLTEGSVKT